MLHLLAAILLCQPQADLPTIVVTKDDTVIDRSCRLSIPGGGEGTIIPDANDNGVIHINADGITVEVTGRGVAELIGAPKGTPYDQMTGIGFRIDGHKNVTLRGVHSHSYRVGIWATNADGLVLDACDVGDGYAMRLKSTPQAEDASDWLWPHENDQGQWARNYGAAILVERSRGVTIKGSYARRRQNGVILDRVTDSKVYDNDFSFLSGWGLAMWRCERNVVSRNRFDFCVRGYSHGVYNRGQDSAGILFFEQNRGNVIAENSATHGGDGFFGFGGKEALGENPPADSHPLDYKGRGNVGNLLIGNDFSYAPAHGIEMTFSFDNRFIDNRLVENAICGVWGGYSQDTLIAKNHFEGNGQMAYGLERGGVNIEHGAGNQILNNTFKDNKCGVHLWWDDDAGLTSTPWAKANDRGSGARKMPSIDNLIAENTFEGDLVALHLRDCDGTSTARNTYRAVGKEIDATAGSQPTESAFAVSWEMPLYQAFGEERPVGAHPDLAGRDKIVMTEWFPWDHQSPLARVIDDSAARRVWEFTGIDGAGVKLTVNGMEAPPFEGTKGAPWKFELAPPAGVTAYTLSVRQGSLVQDFTGTLLNAQWEVAFFHWPRPEPPMNGDEPRIPPDLAAWRALADSPAAVKTTLPGLRFAFGGRGPSGVVDDAAVKAAKFTGDYFGLIARTSLALPPGRWRLRTRSDDGVRVMVAGKTVIENWTHHGAAEDTAEVTIPEGGKPVEIVVEYFEIFGGAVLEFDIEPVGG